MCVHFVEGSVHREEAEEHSRPHLTHTFRSPESPIYGAEVTSRRVPGARPRCEEGSLSRRPDGHGTVAPQGTELQVTVL